MNITESLLYRTAVMRSDEDIYNSNQRYYWVKSKYLVLIYLKSIFEKIKST